MSVIRDVIGDVQRRIGSGKALREEDIYRNLAPNESEGYRLPIVYANNDYLLTPQAAWSGYRVPNKSWGFLAENERRQYFLAAQNFFSRTFPSEKQSGGHLLVTNRVHTAEEWEANMLARNEGRALPSFSRYLREMRNVIDQREFFEREVHLFSRLGARGDEGGVRGFVQGVMDFFATQAGVNDSQPDMDEQDFWSEQSTSMTTNLSSTWLQAQPMHRRAVELLVRQIDTPALPTPECSPADEEVWGAGNWRTVLAEYTEQVHLGVSGKKRYKCVKFEGPTGEGMSYAAFLPLAVIPNALHYGQNWIHHSSTLPFPVDASLRFEIIDTERARDALGNSIAIAEAQEDENAEAGIRSDDVIYQQQQGLRQARSRVQMENRPIAYWQAVFCVYDTDKEALLGKVTKLIRHFSDIDMELQCPPLDQRELFYQSFPGSEIGVNDWIHRTDTEYLAAAQPWLSSTVGDRDGTALYQGYTVVYDANGQMQRGTPVFHELHNVVDQEGRAPVEAVAASPGFGKTVSRGLKTAHETALQGITQFIWDPKGDFLPLAQYAKQMQLDPKKVKLVDLHNPNVSVSLDVFGIAEVDPEKEIDERETAAQDLLGRLCREFVENRDHGLAYRDVIRGAVHHVLSVEAEGGKHATMQGVMDKLKGWRQGEFEDGDDIPTRKQEAWSDWARSLHNHLLSYQRDALGRQMFKDYKEAGTIKVSPGDMVIFVAINMVMTEPGQPPTNKSMIGDAIAGLMTDFIRSLLYTLPDYVPKALTFDEWHAVKNGGRAEALVKWAARMGRSKRCTLRVLSQEAKDLNGITPATIWIGGADDDDLAEESCKFLGLEVSPANITRIRNLGKGQFLFKDGQQPARYAMVQVEIWDQWLMEKFNTSPEAKEAALKALTAQEI